MLFRKVCKVFCFLFNFTLSFTLSAKVISTKTGQIRGIDVATENGIVHAFLGIPYAEPPVGNLRFKKPVPIKPWTNIFNATQKPFPCCQNMTRDHVWFPDLENMTEDCLYLNIWTPNLSSSNLTEPMSTMVWIYGGAYITGSSDMDAYDGARLASYGKVIVASFNYRVGTFGFLTALIDDANGNMGMYDQILALKWLNENIENFGGDPGQITLFGQSAGSISISLHLLSPLSKNLFRRAILESGSFHSPIIYDITNRQIKSSNAIARIVGCADDGVNITTHPQRIVDCLKRMPAKQLTRAEGILISTSILPFFPRYGDEFLPMNFTEIWQENHYKDTELLVGNNEDEGSMFLTVGFPEYFGAYGWNGIENLRKQMAKSIIKATFHLLEEDNVSEIADYYITKNKDLKGAIYNSIGDYIITCPSVFFSDSYSRKKSSKIYYYIFTYKNNRGVLADWMGATHAKEIPFVFGNPILNMTFTNDEMTLQQHIMDRWIAFAKTGNPNIPNAVFWPPYAHNNSVYLDINVVEKVKEEPLNERCEFWKDRFQRRFPHWFPN